MKVLWKEFFYFSNGDKRAIILLLILIVCLGGFIFVHHLYFKKEGVAYDESLAEFDTFQKGLTVINEETPNQGSTDIDDPKPQKNYISTQKLTKGETIELNGASVQTLKRIPGVGDKLASRIYEYKDKLGGFVSVDQLREVQGITEKRFENISTYVMINKNNKKMKVNRLSSDQMSKHPYLSQQQVSAIIDMRGKKNKINSIEELSGSGIFTPRDIARLEKYLSFD
ncbi:MAG: ComEA family DNA-binding protein [Dysgonomonas sp.]